MERNYEINRRIRKLMGCNDKKPEAVADRAGIRRSTFSRIINEKRPVFADEIPHMAAALGCSIEDCLTERHVNQPETHLPQSMNRTIREGHRL